MQYLRTARHLVATAAVPMASNTANAAASSIAGTASPNYDAFAQNYADQVSRLTGLHAMDLVRTLPTKIASSKRILELGCGTGAFGLAYLDVFAEGIPGQTIVCTDLSPAMVGIAQQRTVAKIMQNSVSDAEVKGEAKCQTEFVFQPADATKLVDFNDNSFDLVVSVFGVFLIPDRASTLDEVRRVLQPGGTLATSAWTSTGYNGNLKQAGFGSNLHDAMAMMKVLPAGTAAQDRKPSLLPQFVLDWFEPDSIRDMLVVKDDDEKDSLFSQVDIHRSIHTTVFDSVEHMWNAFTKSSPHAAALLDQEAEQVRLAKEALGQFVAPDGMVDRPVSVFSVSNIVLAC